MQIRSLSARIYLGFALVFLLVLLNAAIGFQARQMLRAAEMDLLEIEEFEAATLRIDRDVQELRLRVSRYVETGYLSLRDDIDLLDESLNERLETLSREQTSETDREVLNQIRAHLQQHADKFEDAVEERELRVSLSKNEIPATTNRIEDKLASLAAIATEEGNAPLELFQLEAAVNRAERLLLRYFADPDFRLVDEALTSIDVATDLLTEMGAGLEPGTTLESLQEDVLEFKRLGIRAVQATRGYMFLTNVVMAGHASEVNHYSGRLRELSNDDREEIVARLAAINRNVDWYVFAALFAAIVLAALIGGRTAYSIVTPIAAITRTFRTLASGKSLQQIPGTDRSDELGDMARAAEVFSEQNERTKELLSESERLTDELRHQTEELEQTNAELDNFAYVASHDLKSPLRAIQNLSRWIVEDAADVLPEESAKHLELMGSRVERMENLLDDLLAYSRAGRQEVDVEEVNLDDLLAGIAEIVDNPGQLQFGWNLEVVSAATYRVPLEQVLLNLISNAVKHNDKAADGYVEISCKRNGDRLQFVVRDNGPGIDAGHHHRVFQMYQRVGDTSVEGTGMGLAIVKKQIERFGGTITLESTLGQGAAFHFTWPIVEGNEAKPAEQ